MANTKIGFIGLGQMGSAMVQRLIDKGYDLTIVANRSRPNVDAAVERGAVEVGSAKEVAQASDVVMLCMDTSASVESRMYGEDGVIAGLKAGSTVIDFGTSIPDSTIRIGAALGEVGSVYLDAPLGKTPKQGRQGLLNIMASGDKDAFDNVRLILDDLGENVFHLGELGTGHKIKLINNFYAMTTVTAMAEVFAMSDKAGVSRQAIYDVMSAGILRSGMMDVIKTYAIEKDSSGLGFSISNARKDVGYYIAMANNLGVPTLLSAGTKQALDLAYASDYADRNVPEVVDFFAETFSSKDVK